MRELITGEYFRTLRVRPALGQLFNAEDIQAAKANPVCIISYAFWQREFAGDTNAIGQSVFLNGDLYRISGVTERGLL